MVYGYARVSTNGQDLDVQLKELERQGCDVVYSEKYTGTRRDRQELKRLLSDIGAGDTLIVCKLDRLARSVKDGVDIIDELLAKGVVIDILNMGKFDTTPAGKLLRSIMFAFAEFERDMIVERTSEGKKVARQREGYREGRPGVDAEVVKRIRQGVGWKELGISRATWYKYR